MSPNAISFQKEPAPNNRKRHRARVARLIVLVGIGVGVVGLLVWAWVPKPLIVETTTATISPMRVTVDEDGVSRVKDRYVVSAPLAGNIERIELEAGDTVEAGRLVARMEPMPAPFLDGRSQVIAEARLAGSLAGQRQTRAQVERALVAKELAAEEAQRAQRLFSTAALPRAQMEQALASQRATAAELDSLRFGERVASYEVEMARAALRRMTATAQTTGEQFVIPAPVSGKVLKVYQKSEGTLQAGMPLLEIGDPGALEVAVDVLTSDAVQLGPGSVVTLDRWGGSTLEGRVRRIEPSAFMRVSALGVEEQRVNVLIDIISPNDTWKTLGDGYRVEAHIVVWETPAALVLPIGAVFRHKEGWACMRVEDGRARLTTVELGHRSFANLEITQGLTAGAVVIMHPSDRVRDGIAVEHP